MAASMPAGPAQRSSETCARCDNPGQIPARSQVLCTSCFEKFIAGKVAKRLDGFKVCGRSAGTARKMLLPVSFGPSSLLLLDLLGKQLRKQLNVTGRQAYNITVVHVCSSMQVAHGPGRGKIEALQRLYPSHEYHLASTESVRAHTRSKRLVRSLKEASSDSFDSNVALPEALESLESGTSRSELCDIAQIRLVTETATTLGCEAIAWGHSMTRLAERTLQDISYGRAVYMPMQNGTASTFSNMNFLFPLQDIFRRETQAFIHVLTPDLISLLEQAPVSACDSPRPANVAVDSLMRQYFESAEKTYPSLVTNVVKTAGRLVDDPTADPSRTCRICASQLLGFSGDQSQLGTGRPKSPGKDEEGITLCESCVKSFGSSIHSLRVSSNATLIRTNAGP